MSPKRSIAGCLAVTLMAIALLPLGPAPPTLASAEPANLSVLYLYATDGATAAGYESFLEANGFDVDLYPLGQFRIYLPVVLRNHPALSQGAAIAGLPVAQMAAAADLGSYDLFVVGPDTGAGGDWAGGRALAASLEALGRPIVGLGQGGHAFFGLLDLPIGHPHGTAGRARQVQVADFGQSRPFYTAPNDLGVEGGDLVDLYVADTDVVSLPLDDRLPDGVRIGALAGSEQYPLAQQDGRYLLWGFAGGPLAMTADGEDLFLNVLSTEGSVYEVALKSRQFTPAPGVEQAVVDALQTAPTVHAWVQLYRLPTPGDRQLLEGKGVELLTYLPDTIYSAVLHGDRFDPDDAGMLELVRWIGLVLPGDKLGGGAVTGQYADWARQASAEVSLLVLFYQHVSQDQVREVLAKYDEGAEPFGALNMWHVVMDASRVAELSAEDSVRWIEQGPAPFDPFNDIARAELFVDPLQDADVSVAPAVYHGLSGSGVTWAVMDSGVDPTHDDFAGRLVRTSGLGSHGTHVGGILGASGERSAAEGGTAFQWRGMAPKVMIASFGHAHANTAVYKEAYVDYAARGSNHSYHTNTEWGLYDAAAASIESVIRGDASHSGIPIPARTYVAAAANQGTAAQYDNEEGYFSIYNYSKNQIILGSLNPAANYALRSSSSRGPTWDQRIKPDVMATGYMISTQAGTNGYVGKGGTSMASPAASGIVALMLEQFDRSYLATTDPWSSTSKALLIQTATDLVHEPGQPGFVEYGWNDPDTGQPVIYHEGPDYATGYGVVNAQEAVRAVRHKQIVEATFDPGDAPHDFAVPVLDGRDSIRCTLAWDDEPGDPAAAETAPKLVNDLDLQLIDPDGGQHLPWVLDPLPHTATPGDGALDPITRATDITPAYRDVDHLNNVEMVLVDDPGDIIAGIWTARVSATALPNGNPQDYSLACDYRQVEIVDAQSLTGSGFPVDAGPAGDPDEVLVRVRVENPYVTPSFTEGYAPDDFEVALGDADHGIRWTAGTVLSVFQVGSEVAIDFRPDSGMDPAYTYDLRVTLVGVHQDTWDDAVQFVEREEVAGYVLTDSSYSMHGGKMEAAQEAGKALVDLLQVDDWVGVGHFGTADHNLMDVTQVVDHTQLDTARGHIDGLIASGSTAMGPGMDLAREKLNAAALPGDTQKIVFLLSDGMENTVEPDGASPPTVGCWDDHPTWDCDANPPYVRTTWPADIQAYVVCLGEAGAAWHAFCDQVAADTSGPPVWHVFETPAGSSSSPRAALATGPGAFPALTLAGHFDHPTTLPVRLDDAYLAMGQTSHRWPRMLEWTGWISPELEYVEVEIDVEEHLPSIHITLEWDEPLAALDGRLQRPDGSFVDPADKDVIYYREEETHRHWGIREPKAETWTLLLIARKGRAEYLVTASGPSDIDMRLLIDPSDRFVYEEIEICALLTDNKPIPASNPAAVAANIIDPAGIAHWQWLFDDGHHRDGGADDGVFCDRYTDVDPGLGGVYQIKAIGAGTANDGRSFMRRATGYTYRKPKVLYVYKDKEIAEEYQKLFAQNAIQADLIAVDELKADSPDLSRYALVVIGPATGDAPDWGTPDALEALLKHRPPTLGLGEGGYALYGKLGLRIGSPYGWHGEERDVYAVDLSHAIWQVPHDLKLKKPEENLYKATRHVGIDIGQEVPAGIELLGREIGDETHYPIIRQEAGRKGEALWNHCLWGYGAGPSSMTDQGRRLFFNVAWYMMR